MISVVKGQLLQRFVITILLTISYSPKRMSSASQSWTYELTDVKFFTSNPDFVESELKVLRIARGVFAISGYYDIKGEIDDSYLVEGALLRRVNSGDEYRPLPFEITNETFSDAMNKFYKPYIMDSVHECTTNAPYFEKFEGPLPKVYVKVDQCKISTENLPSHIPEGLYKMMIMLHGAAELRVETYFEIMWT